MKDNKLIIEKEKEYDKQQEEFKKLLEDLMMEQREQM